MRKLFALATAARAKGCEGQEFLFEGLDSAHIYGFDYYGFCFKCLMIH
jgi:hypothetical protein